MILTEIAVLSFIAAGCSNKTGNGAAADTSTPAATVAATSDHTADAAAILQADSAWLRGVASKNVDSLMTYYAPDAVSYGFGAQPSKGIDQLRASYTEMVKANMTDLHAVSNAVAFSDDGSMAYDHGTYSMTVTPPGGKASKEAGAYLNVWKKVDGKWKMLAEMSTPVSAK